ncbi:MAG: murein biosynthesis integral membrane protein MurJ [Alphaproteobacteria bacterium]|nr:murein biosynthesis integral membrane protein MurJ [Alphaproteobacteria bacterium]
MSLFNAVATVGSYTMISRVTGFARDVLIAASLGAGPIADAFFVAFKLPNFFRRLTAEGSFTIVFVPMFSGILETDGKKIALKFAEEIMSIMSAVLLTITVTAIFFMPQIMGLIAPGFKDAQTTFNLAVEFGRVTFIYLPLISLVALLGGILNSIGKFSAMASAPILLNLFLISSLTIFAGVLETPGHGLALAVAIGGLAQFLWLLESCRRAKALPLLRWPVWTPRVKRLLKLMLPAMFGAGIVQINLLIDVILASTLPTGSISYLYYADRVNQLPLGVIGVAIGTALLPRLSKNIKAGRLEDALSNQEKSLEIGLMLTVPAALGLMVLSDPIITLLFQRGLFDIESTHLTSLALLAYSTGLPAFVLIKILQPNFFARSDTVTPIKIAAIAIVTNLILNLILMQYFAHVGLALATSVSAWLSAILLLIILKKKEFYRLRKLILVKILQISLAACVMAAGLLALINVTKHFFVDPNLTGVTILLLLIFSGGLIYFVSLLLFNAVNKKDIIKVLKRWSTPD